MVGKRSKAHAPCSSFQRLFRSFNCVDIYVSSNVVLRPVGSEGKGDRGGVHAGQAEDAVARTVALARSLQGDMSTRMMSVGDSTFVSQVATRQVRAVERANLGSLTHMAVRAMLDLEATETHVAGETKIMCLP